MAYCSIDDVAKYVTPVQGADVDAAIAVATDIVHEFTGDRFSTTTAPLTVLTNRAGIAYLPITGRTVASVTITDTQEVLPSNLWRFTSGRLASVTVSQTLPFNILIKGREPWAAQRPHHNLSLTVTGNFGYAATPTAVKEATAMLAAQFLTSTGQGTVTEAGGNITGTPTDIASVSVEGYSVTYRDAANLTASTGVSLVDRLLTPYKRPQRGRWS